MLREKVPSVCIQLSGAVLIGEPSVHFAEPKNKDSVQSCASRVKMGILVRRYLLVEEGKEVPHHYKNRPGQGQEELTDVQRPLIEIIDSCRQKWAWSGSLH